ncbi:MAG: SDR family NAD(P)-dependent oxidoreductase [Acidimicrobiales bacterium]
MGSEDRGRLEVGGRLLGKVAIVAGAGQTPGETSGNGRARALRLAPEGARVVCVARVADSAAETVAAITGAGGDALAVTADVTVDNECAELIRRTVDACGRIDILHNSTPSRSCGPGSSDEASFTTGVVLPVDGGQSARIG